MPYYQWGLIMHKLSLLALTLSVTGMAFSANAATVSDQSQSYGTNGVEVKVGPTQSSGGFHGGKVGDPGVGLQSIANGKTIAFSGFKSLAPENSQGVHVLAASSGGHGGGMGEFHFAQVANAEVYFGDWSKTGLQGDQTHTAFYSGKEATTSVPTTGSAEYTLAGINQFDSAGKLSGVFNANFATKEYTGSLTGETLNITMNGDLLDKGQFAGEALANGTIQGESKGQFFGANAETVAGITSFASDHSKDTAFGGNKK